MTKAKAKALVADMIERDLTPEVRDAGGGDYRVAVSVPTGVLTSQVTNIESTQAVTARVHRVEFS